MSNKKQLSFDEINWKVKQKTNWYKMPGITISGVMINPIQYLNISFTVSGIDKYGKNTKD